MIPDRRIRPPLDPGADGHDTGVEGIGDRSITSSDGFWRVKSVRGITPKGEFVLIGEEARSAPAGSAAAGHNVCDLFVSAEDRALIVEPVAHAAPLQPHPHALYLGRWWRDQSDCRLVHRPLPRFLRALEYLSADARTSWQTWLQPLTERLGSILERSRGTSPPTTDSVLVASRATELLLRGADLPLTVLGAELETLAFCCRSMLDGPGASAGHGFAPSFHWSPGSVIADDLPQELADLCDPLAPQPVPKVLRPKVDYVLETTSGGGWKLRFPKPVQPALEIKIDIGAQPLAPSIRFEHGRSLQGLSGLNFEYYKETCQYVTHVPKGLAALADPATGWNLHNLSAQLDLHAVLSIFRP